VITYDGQATIERSAEEVFAYASLPENLLEWSDVSSVERLTDGPVRVGSRMKITMGKPPLRATSDYEISEWEENRRWTYKTIPPNWILWDATYVLEPLGPSSTRISTSGQITLKGIRRALEPVIRNELSKGEQGELDRLKALLEE
jgi:hypothetical protein